jgi:hypothetical protein
MHNTFIIMESSSDNAAWTTSIVRKQAWKLGELGFGPGSVTLVNDLTSLDLIP